jgi:hypothetical protein
MDLWAQDDDFFAGGRPRVQFSSAAFDEGDRLYCKPLRRHVEVKDHISRSKRIATEKRVRPPRLRVVGCLGGGRS